MGILARRAVVIDPTRKLQDNFFVGARTEDASFHYHHDTRAMLRHKLISYGQAGICDRKCDPVLLNAIDAIHAVHADIDM